MNAATSSRPQEPPLEEAYGRAMALQMAGELGQAEPIYREILAAHPDHAGAHYCLGMLLVHLKRPADGSPHLLSAVNNAPQVAEYWLGYLEALLLLGEHETAAQILSLARQHGLAGAAADDFARRLEASNPLEREAAVLALVNQGLFREALPLAREMTQRFPRYGIGWKMLGAMLWATGSENEAIEAMQTSVRLLPQDAEASKNLAAAVNKHQRLMDAEHHLRRALEINPNYAPAHLILGHNYQLQGRYEEARRSLQSAIDAQGEDTHIGLESPRSLLLFVLNNDPSVDADSLFAEHRRVGAYFERIARGAKSPGNAADGSAPGHPPVRRPPRSARAANPDRCLRVGFVSADLYGHSVGHFVEPLFAAWQRSQSIRTSVYYVNKVEDVVSRRLRSYVADWRPVLDTSSAELEQLIRDDDIDILIDLSGHTALHRLDTFARKPAPIQASWLGYPNTTGLAAVDYYLADKHFLPPGQFDRYFTEKIVHLPAAWSFEPSRYAPPVNPLPALAAARLTFGSFNRIAKLNEPTVRLWSQLLRAVPGSRLMIAGVPLDVAHHRLAPWFAAGGIGPERLSFHAYSGQDHQFALHHQVDIGLEPMPYSGCTTSNHALWMGVPSLTCVGTTPASRLSAANLGHLGLDEFIAVSPEDFVAKGLRWVNDLPALAEVRAGLRARWQAAPARNAEFFAAGMELALRRMWRHWCAGLPAESFEITAEQAAAKAAR
jgi:predicted O-linked N-acetylglucosamine transferase (SPINDLY family)